MLTFTSTQVGASSDYVRYLWGSPTKTDRYKDSDLLDFALAPVDSNFVKLTRGAYIKLNSTTYPNWFTGFIINDPELSWIGVGKNRQKVWGYKYQATSDEYILSMKPLGVVTPFLNTSMGGILKALAERILPGFFDYTSVQDGPILAQYVVDPNKKYVDIVHEFSESSNYLFYANNKKLYFIKQDDSNVGLTLDGNDKNFTPSRLDIKPADNQIINDVTVLGGVEPQDYVTEYFIGTGLDATFPLVSSVFGVDSSVLLDETFSGSGIDSSKWGVFDQPQGYLKVDSGYLNCFGGNNYDVSIRSVSPIPLEGTLRITHGEWDFINTGNAVIGGLWTKPPAAGYSGCVFGFEVYQGSLRAIENGAVVASPSVTLSTSKRYIIRTIVEFDSDNRSKQAYSYLNDTGSVVSVSGQKLPDVAQWTTVITEIEPTTGAMSGQWTLHNATTLQTTDLYATYVPVVSAGLSCTVTGITISVPIAATLELADYVPIKNSSFDAWTTTLQDWTAHSAYQETQFADDGSSCKLQGVTAGDYAYLEQPASGMFIAGKKYKAFLRMQRNAALNPAAGDWFRIALVGTDLNYEIVKLTGSGILAQPAGKWFSLYTGTTQTPLPSLPSDAKLRIEWTSSAAPIWIDTLTITSDWQTQLVGVNDIDAMDGLSPVATIVQGNTGSDTKSTYFGVGQYNPGQAQLVFFKDSITRTSNTPPANQLIRLSYRSAGPAVGRVVNRAVTVTESSQWGDDGVRSVVKTDVVPRPRTSNECEMAAAAMVAENSFLHYTGTYRQYSMYMPREPRAGAVVKFLNLTDMATNLQAEEINEVKTTWESKEVFIHEITFGRPQKEKMRKALQDLGTTQELFQRDNASYAIQSSVDVKSILDTRALFAPDVVSVDLKGWSSSNLFVVPSPITTLTQPGEYYEVRYTDTGWGSEDGKNLVTNAAPVFSGRTTTPDFTIPRNLRGRVFFVRRSVMCNMLPWSEELTRNNYTGYSSVLVTSKKGPDNETAYICTVSLVGNQAFVATAVDHAKKTSGCFSFSIKGPAGTQIIASYGSNSVTVKLTGFWQRISVSGSGTQGRILSASSVSVDITRMSIEYGTISETRYIKTKANPYGSPSRYASVVHVSFPAPSSSDVTSAAVRPTH